MWSAWCFHFSVGIPGLSGSEYSENVQIPADRQRSIRYPPAPKIALLLVGNFRMSFAHRPPMCEPVVITGIGMLTSVGETAESTWQAVQRGKSGVRYIEGLRGIPNDLIIGAPVDIDVPNAGQLKVIALAQQAARAAIEDAALDWSQIDRDRFACAISGHMGDTAGIAEIIGYGSKPEEEVPAWHQWLPNTACSEVAIEHGLYGPRSCHSTACASGLIDILSAVRRIRDGQCDLALAGSAETINPLFAAGFRQLRVLAKHQDPIQACRPFDRDRSGFVMGEGSAMFVLERLGHALARGARIYAELSAGAMLGEAHHVTSMSQNSDPLRYLITETLRRADMEPSEIGYINAHGTGTRQNDLVETRGIRAALGHAASDILVGANKSSIGHLVNAAGSVELALTVLSLRDGFAPPTLNLYNPDPECDLDCVPLVGRVHRAQSALKLSCAFGGHLVCMAVRRWTGIHSKSDYSDQLPSKAA
jgi:3-oxoacyl-(acyl-carrier-protein) synthase